MIIAAYLLALLGLILNASLFIHLKPPNNFYFVIPQILAVVLSPVLAALALIGAGLGWLSHAPIAVALGLLSAGISVIYIVLVTVPQPGFELAFGKDWKTGPPSPIKSQMLKRRWDRPIAPWRLCLGLFHPTGGQLRATPPFSSTTRRMPFQISA